MRSQITDGGSRVGSGSPADPLSCGIGHSLRITQLRRIRFSLLFMQLAVLFGAVLLSLPLLIEPGYYWRHMAVVMLLLVFHGILFWLVLAAPWSARFAAIGFLLGAIAEFMALNHAVESNQVRLMTGMWTPEGWYPLALPVERLLVTQGWAVIPSSTLPAMFIGLALSGAVGGVLMLGSRSLWWMVRRRNPSSLYSWA